MKNHIPVIASAAIGSGGLWALVQSRMTRHDVKEDRHNEILDKISELSKKIDAVSDKVDENSATLARTHILRFADELTNGVDHSNEYFKQTIQDIDTYERFCDKHPDFKNNGAVLAIEYIKATYIKLLEKGEFRNE